MALHKEGQQQRPHAQMTLKVRRVNFVVKHQMGKFQTNVDTLSRLPMAKQNDENLCAIISPPQLVQDELREITMATQHGNHVWPDLNSLNGYSFDKQGLVILRPFATCNLI